jgi:hypothetical protein
MTMDKEHLQEHHNAGQRDASDPDRGYEGWALSWRNSEEHEAYNEGYDNASKQK